VRHVQRRSAIRIAFATVTGITLLAGAAACSDGGDGNEGDVDQDIEDEPADDEPDDDQDVQDPGNENDKLPSGGSS
jgi:hypothetical protein